MFDEFRSWTEEVFGRNLHRFEKPRLGLFHSLNRPVFENVTNVHRVRSKMTAHEHRSMASDRVFFRTHESDSVSLDSTPKPVQSLTKGWKAGDEVVSRLLLVVTLTLRTPRSEFSPKEDVLNPRTLEQLCERLSIELTVEAAVWMRTNVGNRGDTVLRDQRYELRHLVVGVPNREEVRFCTVAPDHGNSNTVATTL